MPTAGSRRIPAASNITVGDRLVFLDWAYRRGRLVAGVTIIVEGHDRPLNGDEIAVIVLRRGGSYLAPIAFPDPDVLPVVRTAGASASCEFSFKCGRGDIAVSAIVVVRGRWSALSL